MFTRRCPLPDRSCFLLGLRSTGKSAWIRSTFPAAATYDLLDAAEAIRLAAEPGVLTRETAKGFTAIEVKSTTNWRSQASPGPARLAADLGPRKVRCFGVYLGARAATYEPCTVLPLAEFLRLLWAGEILG